MRALVCGAYTDNRADLRLEDISLPPLAPDDVRVAVRAASVNFPDLPMAQGKYQHRPELPFVVGGELAGEAIAVGSGVAAYKRGDRVLSAGLFGAIATEAQRPAGSFRHIPENIEFAHAACYSVAYLTAYVGLVRERKAIGKIVIEP